jgi:diguanylate cyclase (GGDEF)-like protein
MRRKTAQFVRLFHQYNYCLILLDVNLPDVSGFDICRTIRESEHGKQVPIVMITGRDDRDSIARSYDCGATDFIAKPINWSLIGFHLRYVLRSAENFAALRRSEQRLEQAQEMARIGYWELDLNSDEVRFSFQLSKILSLPSTGFEHGMDTLSGLIHSSERYHFRSLCQKAAEYNYVFDLETPVQVPGQETLYCRIHGQQLSGDSSVLVGTIQDISKQKESQERLTHIAHHDSLTDLPNRALFHRLLEGAIDRSNRNNKKVALLFIDLDRFKNINDSLGHEVGDSLLIKVAERLRSVIRAYDTVARLGGDEFAVTLDCVENAQSVSHLTQRVLEAFELPFVVREHSLHIDASVGISIYPDNGTSHETLLRNADTAMYQAKRNLHCKLAFYSSELTEETLKTWTLENELREALEKDQLRLLYQPKVDPANHEIKGVEALIRWDRGELGIVSPADFLPVAEDTGLIIPIGKWVIKTAIAQLAQWQGTRCEQLTIAVNVSAGQLHDTELCHFIQQELQHADVCPSLLEVELTEEYLIEANVEGSHCQDTLKTINHLGISMAIDDFGTGYSSLSQLKNLPISTLKIDKSFVDYVPENQKDVAMVLSIVNFARNLGLQVVAEGVETEEQRRCIHSYGCDLVQGYVYSKPIPAQEVENLMEQDVLKRHLA